MHFHSGSRQSRVRKVVLDWSCPSGRVCSFLGVFIEVRPSFLKLTSGSRPRGESSGGLSPHMAISLSLFFNLVFICGGVDADLKQRTVASNSHLHAPEATPSRRDRTSESVQIDMHGRQGIHGQRKAPQATADEPWANVQSYQETHDILHSFVDLDQVGRACVSPFCEEL